jgi:hypothetical protein
MSMRELSEYRRRHGRAWPIASALCATGLIAGCASGRDLASSDGSDVEVSLAALMADGPLPPEMRPGTIDPFVPPRFCDGGGFPGPFPGPIPGTGGSPAPRPVPADAGVAEEGPSSAPDDMGMSGGGVAGTGAAGTGVAGAGGTGTGGSAGGPMDPDGGFPDFPDSPGCESTPIGFWRFDDCNQFRTDLSDSSPERHTAYRNVSQQCVETQEGLGAAFTQPTDIVYAPDQPGFALSKGVTVAAWVKADNVTGTRTLFRKRDGENSAFALVINGKKYQFAVRLSSGKLVSVSAPATAGLWTHVAATYDNESLRLYLDGQEVSAKAAPGVLAKGPGPLLIGNDASDRRLEGVMDNAWFNVLAAPPETILELTCLRGTPTLSVTPEVGPEVPAGTPVDFVLSVTNNNSAVCRPEQFIGIGFGSSELSVQPFFQIAPPVGSGETAELPFTVSSSEEAEPDHYPITFGVFSFERGVEQTVQAEYVVAPPDGCHVASGRELMIRHVSVVDDPVRTSMDGDPADPRTGAWAFGRLMERLSPSDALGPDVTEEMFRSFAENQTVNGFTIEARPAIMPFVLDPWPRTPSGQLDLSRAPLRLLAIVNRLDLKDLAAGKAGEGRMVYGVLDENGFPMEFTVILEYLLPADDEDEYRAWADAFHALQALPFPSEEYNAALQAITDRFTGRNAMPGMPNGSSLIDIRTNEITLSFQWELREFHISAATGFLVPAGLFQTPDASFNFGSTLARFINENEEAILAETHDAPATFEGQPFKAGSVFNNIDIWFAPGINDPEARHKFSLNTCNGCHGGETDTGFLHVFPRFEGEQSFLSGFLTGITVFDPVTGEPRRLAELSRRRALLQSVVCEDDEHP